MTKIAVVLFNLGGPDSKEAIRPFLYNFFTDPNIIQLPAPLRAFVANRIANKRTKGEAGSSYKELDYRSPLLDNTNAQSAALEKALNDFSSNPPASGGEARQSRAGGDDIYKTFVCMRYWHPMSEEVAHAVKNWAPDKIILLPLYPQFSTTTSGSSLQAWNAAADKIGLSVETAMVCCYPNQKGFIDASAKNILTCLESAQQNHQGKLRLLFSAHGLPEKIIKSGDPYQWQCEQSAEAIAKELNIPNLDWQICYQSRVGPLKWIGPSTEEALHKAAEDKVGVLIYPHAFVSEHVETLVEIDMEYRALAENLGIPYFARVPTVGVHEDFIGGLATAVKNHAPGITSNQGTRLCPATFKRCCDASGAIKKVA